MKIAVLGTRANIETSKSWHSRHAGAPDLMKLFKPHCDRILFTHLGNWFMDDVSAGRKKIIQLADEHGIDAVIGYDGLEIIL